MKKMKKIFLVMLILVLSLPLTYFNKANEIENINTNEKSSYPGPSYVGGPEDPIITLDQEANKYKSLYYKYWSDYYQEYVYTSRGDFNLTSTENVNARRIIVQETFKDNLNQQSAVSKNFKYVDSLGLKDFYYKDDYSHNYQKYPLEIKPNTCLNLRLEATSNDGKTLGETNNLSIKLIADSNFNYEGNDYRLGSSGAEPGSTITLANMRTAIIDKPTKITEYFDDDFFINLKDAPNFNVDSILDTECKFRYNSTWLEKVVTYNPEDIKAINDATDYYTVHLRFNLNDAFYGELNINIVGDQYVCRGDKILTSANDITIPLNIAKHITSDEVIKLSNAKSWDMTNNKVNSLFVEGDDLNKIHETTEPTVLETRVAWASSISGAYLTIKTNIVEDAAVGNGISAYINSKDCSNIRSDTLDDFLKNYLNVEFLNHDILIPNDDIKVVLSDISKKSILEGKEGSYLITFKYNDIELSKQLYILNNDYKISTDKQSALKYNNGVITQAKAQSLQVKQDIYPYIKLEALEIKDNSSSQANLDNITYNDEIFEEIKKGEIGPHSITLNWKDHVFKQDLAPIISIVSSDAGNNNLFISSKDLVEINLKDKNNLINNWKDTSYFDVYAWDREGKDLTNQVSIKPDLNTIDKPGLYPFDLSLEYNNNKTTKKVYVSVVDDTTVKNDNIRISGKNFSKNLNEVSTLNRENIIKFGNIEVWDIANKTNINDFQLTPNDLLNTTEVGAYPILIVKDNAKKNIFVNIYDNSTITKNNVNVTANNFKINLSEAKKLDDANAKSKAQAKAWYSDGAKPDPTIIVDNEELSAIQNATVSAVYPLTFTANDVTKIINVTIIDNVNYTIEANNFTINQDQAKTLDLATVKTDANVQVLNSQQQEEPSMLDLVALSDESQLATINERKLGSYPLDLKLTGYDATKQIYINVVNENVNTNNNENIIASDFTINLSDVSSLNDDSAIEKAQAKAWYSDSSNPLAITVNQEQLQAIQNATVGGQYKLTFTAGSASKEITVNVIDNVNYIIKANNFSINSDEANSLDIKAIREKANVEVLDKEGQTQPQLIANVVVKNQSQLDVIKAGKIGAYPLDLTLNDNLVGNAQIFINIVDNTTVTKDNTNLSANNFTIKLSEVKDLTDADVIEKAQAKAWYSDGTKPDPTITIDYDELNAIQNATGFEVYPLTFTANDVTKIINVTIIDNVNYTIEANNFTINQDQAKTLDLATVKTDANVQVLNSQQQEEPSMLDLVALSDESQLATINEGKLGSYPLDLKLTGYDATKQIYINVVNENVNTNNNENIIASDFTINLSDVSSLNDDSAIEKAQAKAWYSDSSNPLAITVNQEQLQAIQNATVGGQYKLTFTAGSASKEITVNIIDNVNYIIKANNFSINSDEAKTLDIKAIREKANVEVLNKEGQVQPQLIANVVVKNQSQLDVIKAGKIGAYPLDLTLNDNLVGNAQIFINIVDNTTVTKDNTNLSANNFTIKLSEVKDLTDADVIEKAQAKAWYSDGTKPDPTITIDYDELNAIQNATGFEVYPLTFTANDVTKIINVTIIDNVNYTIEANNFTINQDQAKTLDLATVKTDANVKVLNSQQQEEPAMLDLVALSDESQLATINEGKLGSYPLDLKLTGYDATKQIYINVVNENVNTNNNENIIASDFTINLSDVSSLNDDSAIEKAQAKAWYSDSSNPLAITVNQEQLQAIQNATVGGQYKLTFTAGSASKEITVNVIDNVNYIIKANNFTINSDEAKTLDIKAIREKANVEVLDKEGQVQPQLIANVVVKNQSQLDVIKAGKIGPYPLDLTLSDNLVGNAQIFINIVDNTTVTKDNTNLSANNFTIKLSEVKDLTDADAIEKAQAKAWYSDGTKPDPTITIDYDELNAIQNATGFEVYPLTFTANDVTKIINVTIIDNVNYTIEANNFTINQDQAKTLDLATVKTDANVKVLNSQQQEEPAMLDLVALSDESQLATINEGKLGSYPLDLKLTGYDATKQIYINVVNENVNTNNNENIIASDFTINLSDVSSLNDDNAIEKAQAKAWYSDSSNPLAITVNQEQLQAIQNATVGGQYKLTFTAGSASKEITVNVIDNVNYIIKANNFTINSEEAKTLDNSQAKQLANVKVINDKGEEVPSLITNIEIKNHQQLVDINKGNLGAYPLTFILKEFNTETTIYVSVENNDTIVDGNIRMNFNNFAYDLANVEQLDKLGLITNANVKVWNVETGHNYTDNEIILSPDSLTNITQVGAYPVSVTVDNRIRTNNQFIVSIYDNNTETNNNNNKKAADVFLDAIDSITISQDQIKQFKENWLTDLQVKAWKSNGSNLTNDVAINGLDNINSLGRYEVELILNYQGQQISKTIEVNVEEQVDVVPPITQPDNSTNNDNNHETTNNSQVNNDQEQNKENSSKPSYINKNDTGEIALIIIIAALILISLIALIIVQIMRKRKK